MSTVGLMNVKECWKGVEINETMVLANVESLLLSD